MGKLLTKPDYWLEQSLPLWALASENEYKTDCERDLHKYSIYRKNVAYCASCGKSLDWVEGKESYD